MARVGRLAGAILAETHGEFYLVGNTKVPCDWDKAGFEAPGDIDALARPFVRLSPRRATRVPLPHVLVDVEDEALPRLLTELFVIARTGSVSDRLWRLVTEPSDHDEELDRPDVIQAHWLGEVPARIWQIVRDTVLRCS